MAGKARVKSIDALQSMSAAVQCFKDDAASALDDLDMEIRRAVQWIGEDCRQYWKMEIHKSWDRVTEAKRELEHAQMFRKIDDHRPSCIEEKKALAMAKRRLEFAQSKVEAISRWVVAIERAVNEYRGIRSHLINWLDSDFPRAIALVGRMASALETYIRLQTPLDNSAPISDASKAPAAETQTADSRDKVNQKSPEP
jgi:hypothetical protein